MSVNFGSTPGADSTAVFGLYKDVFEEGIAEGVNNSNPLGDVFKREKVDYKGGKGHTFVAHVGRNPSPMFVAEDGAFAGSGAWAQGKPIELDFPSWQIEEPGNAEYWTELPPKAELEQKLHAALREARERLARRGVLLGNLDDE